MYLDYSYDRVKVRDLSQAFFDPTCALTLEAQLTTTCATVDINNLTPEQLALIQSNPYLYDSLLIGQRRAPHDRESHADGCAELGGQPGDAGHGPPLHVLVGGGRPRRRHAVHQAERGEAVWFLQQNKRISLGLRAQAEYIRPYGQKVGTTNSLPIFEKLVLGGGYSVRGYDLRTIGPSDPTGRVVIGGNKSLLFNAEYLINIAGPVRLILFYDAGQVKDTCGVRSGSRPPAGRCLPR